MNDSPVHPKFETLRKLPTFLRYGLIYSLAAWIVYNVYTTISLIALDYSPLASMDYWRIVGFWGDYRSLHIGVLWRQHNEHRIVFPEIVFALDMVFAYGRQILPIVVDAICFFLAWLVLALSVVEIGEFSLYERSLVFLMSGVVASWPGVSIVLAHPFLLQWPLMQLTVAAALLCLKKSADYSNTKYLFAAISSAVVATYSSANALVLWPLLLTIGFIIHLSKRFMAILAVSAAAAIGLYFVGYQFSSQTNLRALLLNPGHFLGFISIYIAMPFAEIKSPAFGIGIGLVNIAIVLSLVVAAKRRQLLSETPSIVLFGYYVFTLLTICVTASGRMDPNDPNFTAARVARYLSVPLLNWVAFLLLCLWMSARLQWRILTTRRLTIISALVMLISVYRLRSWEEINSREFADIQFAALSIDDGLTDEQIIARIFPSPEFVDLHLADLEKRRSGIFYRDHRKWLGQRLSEIGTIKPPSIPGAITYSYAVEHGLEVVGWEASPDKRDPFPRIFLANERGQVVGFGKRLTAGFPQVLHSLNTPSDQAWVAFANFAIPCHTISAYVATRHGLVPLEGSASIPALQAASKDEAGQPIKNVAWQTTDSWVLNMASVNPRFGWLPSPPFYSSGVGAIRDADRTVAEFAAPADACVVLPILHGPSAEGASAQLIDSDSGAVLADLPMRDQDPLWSLWRVPIPTTAKRLRLVAIDNLRGWGQWLAVSTPLSCK